MESAVITGTGLVCSLGTTPQETFQALLSGRQGICPIVGFETQGLDGLVGAQVCPFDPSLSRIHPRDARIMGIHSNMLMKCSQDAFVESGLNRASVPREGIGFFVGMGMVDYEIADLLSSVMKSRGPGGMLDYKRFFEEGYREIYPLWPFSMLNNVSLCQVAIRLGIGGENAVFSPHADSGAQAIAEGVRTIQDQKADAVLVGGVSEKISPLSLARGQLAKILNTDEPIHRMACRPFSERRKGALLGEGCGVLVLESRASALRRGVPFVAKVSGYESACEREGQKPTPTTKAMARAMSGAIRAAGIEPWDIDLIMAHGDGTAEGDGNEIEAIHRVFSSCLEKMAVFSSKGALGHLLAGSSAVDAVLAVQMIQHGVIPGTLNADPLERHIRFHVVHGKGFSKNMGWVLINSRSHEGPCASLIVEACH
jgi:3-oxoacyl-[acyl-carrier-protein] synthase II